MYNLEEVDTSGSECIRKECDFIKFLQYRGFITGTCYMGSENRIPQLNVLPHPEEKEKEKEKEKKEKKRKKEEEGNL